MLVRSPRMMRLLLNLYPPYLGAGIRVEHISPDFRTLRVAMKLRWYNRNLVGTHFGGSLYSMCDPMLMTMLLKNLDGRYVVWDQAATIRFVRPGRGTVRAEFRITETDLEEIRAKTADGEKFSPRFSVNVRNEEGKIVARVEKTLYVRLKQAFQQPASV